MFYGGHVLWPLSMPPGRTLSQIKRKLNLLFTLDRKPHLLACCLLQLQVRYRTLGSLHKALAWKSGVGVDDAEMLPGLKSQWSRKPRMISIVFNSCLVLARKCPRAENKSVKIVKGTWTEAFFGPSICSLFGPVPIHLWSCVPLVRPSWVVSHRAWTKVPKWSSSLEICKCALVAGDGWEGQEFLTSDFRPS